MLEAGRFTVIVVERTLEATDVVSLELELPEGGVLPEWHAGAHIDVGVGVDEVRQYSLCGSPESRQRWRIGVLNEQGGRGGSRFLHEHAHPGATLSVSMPRNNFPLVESARYAFVAGGIGITPLIPMIAAVERAGADWRLFYGGRSRATMGFTEELSAYGDRVAILPQDEVGLLPLAEIVTGVGPQTEIYCCGPEPLLAAVESIAEGSLHVERFAPRANAFDGPDVPFDVPIASTGKVIRVESEQSLADALERSGVSVPTSCREGTCSTCEIKVLDGVPIHRDSVLSDEERARGESMMVCVSRASASSILLLDL